MSATAAPTVEITETVVTVTVSPVVVEAERLDRLFPGWADRIDIDELDVSDASCCVLAQGAPHVAYNTAIEIVLEERHAEGIDTSDGVYARNRWLSDWIQEIRRRRRS